MRGPLARLACAVAVLGVLVGTLGAAMVVVMPVPAKGAPQMALLRNGYASGIDAGAGPVWVLALGTDARPGEDILHQRADAIHLIGMNPANGAGVIVGFPRDAFVNIPGRGVDKINAALTYGGPELVAATVESLTSIHPQYIFVTTFEGLTRMVDRLGGVSVDVDRSMHDPVSGSDFEPGPQMLEGGQALAFTRDRHLSGGDFVRSKHQGDLLMATLAKVADDKGPGRLDLALNILLDDSHMVAVDFPAVYRLARLAVNTDRGRLANCVAYGGVGMAGGASIVSLDYGSLQALSDDIRPDATVDQGCPPVPNI